MAKTRTSPKRRKRNARIAHYTGAALMGVGAIGSGHYSGTASRQAIDAKLYAGLARKKRPKGQAFLERTHTPSSVRLHKKLQAKMDRGLREIRKARSLTAKKHRAAAKISKRRVWPWAATAIAGLGIWYKSGKTLQELKKSTGS